jgi:hypothetical protein
MELSIRRAARTYLMSRDSLKRAIRRGAVPAYVVPVLEVRVQSKDVEAYLKGVSPGRRAAGRRNGGRNKKLAPGPPASAPPPPAA